MFVSSQNPYTDALAPRIATVGNGVSKKAAKVKRGHRGGVLIPQD